MTQKKSPPRSAVAALRHATTALKAGEAVGAAVAVIAARTELAAQHAAMPTFETGAEMGLMVTEKFHAFSQAGVAVASGAADITGRSARFAAQESAEAGRAFLRFAACRTPAEVMVVQASVLTGFWGRTYAYGLGLNSVAARTGEKALDPVHRTVTNNHKRLGRNGG